MPAHPQHIQISLNAPPEAVFTALTDSTALQSWFAEHADVSLADKRYDFWGRFTPENPTRENGHHPILEVQPNQYLKFAWPSLGEDSVVEIALKPANGGTLLMLRHQGKNYEDAWFLALENLRRHVEGNGPAVFYDYTRPTTGTITHHLDINAPTSDVFAVLTEPEQLNRWIASDAKVNLVEGGEWDLGWTGVPPLQILSLKQNEELSGKYLEEGGFTSLSWTLEESDGKTHLTFVQSGFAADRRNDDLNSGWLNFMSWVKAAAEGGPTWSPALKELNPDYIPYYPGSMGARQSEITWSGPETA